MKAISGLVLLLLSGCATFGIGPDVSHTSSLSQHFGGANDCQMTGSACWGFNSIGVAAKVTTGPIEWRASDTYSLESVYGKHWEIFEAHATWWFYPFQ